MNIKGLTHSRVDRLPIEKMPDEKTKTEKRHIRQKIDAELKDQTSEDSFCHTPTIKQYKNYARDGRLVNTAKAPQTASTEVNPEIVTSETDILPDSPTTTAEDTPSAAAITTLSVDNPSATDPEPVKTWTDEEYHEATVNLFFGNGRENEVDLQAYTEERIRRSLLAKQDNQFYFVLRDFSQGIVDDTRVYSGYDKDIFYNMAVTFSEQRNNILLTNKNLSRFISPEEADNRLNHLNEQFDEAFAKLAQMIQIYSDATGGGNVSTDIKAYGETVKSYICSGNTISRGGDSSAFYAYLNENTEATRSLNKINEIGSSGQPKSIWLAVLY